MFFSCKYIHTNAGLTKTVLTHHIRRTAVISVGRLAHISTHVSSIATGVEKIHDDIDTLNKSIVSSHTSMYYLLTNRTIILC